MQQYTFATFSNNISTTTKHDDDSDDEEKQAGNNNYQELTGVTTFTSTGGIVTMNIGGTNG